MFCRCKLNLTDLFPTVVVSLYFTILFLFHFFPVNNSTLWSNDLTDKGVFKRINNYRFYHLMYTFFPQKVQHNLINYLSKFIMY